MAMKNIENQEQFEKLVRDYFESSNFSNEKKAEFAELFIKYSRYDSIKNYVLNVIKKSYDYKNDLLENLEKTGLKDRVKREFYNEIMKYNYLADVHDVAAEARDSVVDDHNDRLEKIKKTSSDKSRNSMREKNSKLKREAAYLQETIDNINDVSKKVQKKAVKDAEVIERAIQKKSRNK